jgi:hypothetical protein
MMLGFLVNKQKPKALLKAGNYEKKIIKVNGILL